MAKTSQETKSGAVLLPRAVPQPVPAVLAQEATNSNKMAFLLQTCSEESSEALQSELCYEMLLWGVSW